MLNKKHMKTLETEQPLQEGRPEFTQGEVIRVDGQIFIVLSDSDGKDSVQMQRIGGDFVYKMDILLNESYNCYYLSKPYKDPSFRMQERSISYKF